MTTRSNGERPSPTSGMPIYPIGKAARITSIPTPTLRNWEARYGAVVPARTEGGQRRYSDRDLGRLIQLHGWITNGYSAREAHSFLEDLERASGSGSRGR